MPNSVNLDKFYADNAERIAGIANANDVDTGVARAMLLSNIRGDTNYAGGGVADMGQLARDYQAAINADNASSYASSMSDLARKQYEAQKKTLERQTANTISQINEQRRLAQKAYEQQQRENYIQNELSKNQLNDYLAAMGYSGGMAESTLANLNNQYINNRIGAQDEYNNAMAQLDQLVQQAYLTGDENLANLAANYYNQLMSALGQQQQYDYQRQLQLENYAREDAQALEENNFKNWQMYLNGQISPDQARSLLAGTRYADLITDIPYALAMSGSGGSSRRSGGGSGGSGGGSEPTIDPLAPLLGDNNQSSRNGWNFNIDYAQDLAAARNGIYSIQDIYNNPDFISKYGIDRYRELLAAAQERYRRDANLTV